MQQGSGTLVKQQATCFIFPMPLKDYLKKSPLETRVRGATYPQSEFKVIQNTILMIDAEAHSLALGFN